MLHKQRSQSEGELREGESIKGPEKRQRGRWEEASRTLRAAPWNLFRLVLIFTSSLTQRSIPWHDQMKKIIDDKTQKWTKAKSEFKTCLFHAQMKLKI